MELRRSSYLITLLSPGAGEKTSKCSCSGCTLLRFSVLSQKAFSRTGKLLPIIVIQDGLDGFWIRRVLQDERMDRFAYR
jgi:hypothetical protein